MTEKMLLKKYVLKDFLRRGAGAYLALIVLFAVCSFTSAEFFSLGNLSNILKQVSYSGIIALGMTFIIASGGIDLSAGSLFALCGVTAVTCMNNVSQTGVWPALTALAVSLMCGAMCGAFNGAVIVLGRIPPFIVTLGTYSVYRSLALYTANSGAVRTPDAMIHKIESTGAFFLPLSGAIMLLAAVVFSVLMNKTVFGKHLCATGANEKVARYAGINTGFVKLCAYTLTGLCAGLAAFLMAGRLNAVNSTDAGAFYELDAIAAVIIGGTSLSGGRGTLAGTVAGVLILGLVSNILIMWEVNSTLQGVVKGLVIIISVLIQRKEKQS